MTKRTISIGLIASVLLISGAVSAQAICSFDYQNLVRSLGEVYEEHRLMLGINREGKVVEIYVNEETGTWTIITTASNGHTCAIMEGEGATVSLGRLGI